MLLELTNDILDVGILAFNLLNDVTEVTDVATIANFSVCESAHAVGQWDNKVSPVCKNFLALLVEPDTRKRWTVN